MEEKYNECRKELLLMSETCEKDKHALDVLKTKRIADKNKLKE